MPWEATLGLILIAILLVGGLVFRLQRKVHANRHVRRQQNSDARFVDGRSARAERIQNTLNARKDSLRKGQRPK